MAAKGEHRADGWHICWLPPLDDGTLSIYFGLWCGGDCVLWTAPVAAPPAANHPATALGPPVPVPAEVPNAHPHCLRKLLPESDAEWTSLRAHARWSVCVCGGGHAALPQLLPCDGGRASDAQQGAPPPSRLAEPDPALLESLLPAYSAALAPLSDARLMLADAHESLQRLNASSPSVVLQQLLAQVRAASRRLDDAHGRLAHASGPADAAAPNGRAASEPDPRGSLLGKLCVMAAAHYAAPLAAPRAADGQRAGAAAGDGDGQGGQEGGGLPAAAGSGAGASAGSRAAAPLQLPCVSVAGSAGSVRDAMAVARWSALSGVAIYGGKLGAPKGASSAAHKRPVHPKKPAKAPAGEARPERALGGGVILHRAGSADESAARAADEAHAAARLAGGGSAAAGSGPASPANGSGKAAAKPAGLKRQQSDGDGSSPHAQRGAAPQPAQGGPSAKRPKPPAPHTTDGRKAGKAPAAPRPAAAKKPAPPDNMRTRVMPSALRVLLSMGYLRDDAESALRRVGGADIQHAIELLAGDSDA